MAFYLLIGALAYLLGSIPFGLILVRVFRRQDVRTIGSGNIGATNVIRAGGKVLGALTFLLDAAKGFAAVIAADLIARHTLMPASTAAASAHAVLQNALAIAGLCAILGHIFPAWLRFRGGKGVATAFGVFLGIAPLPALIALVSFVLIFAISRYVSVASLLGAAAFAVSDWLLFGSRQTLLLRAVILVAVLLIVVKHSANIRRLATGTESRFGRPRTTPA
jgi:glycerol-3-phosphate acyltransferase PlsY